MAQGAFHLGLVGFPLGHSLSPAIHAAALACTHLEGDYRLFPVPEGPGCKKQLAGILEEIRTHALMGVNVTIPYKQMVIPLLDQLTPVALATGAVNTIFAEGDRLVGDNTDVAGFSCDLLDFGFDYLSYPAGALILGSGGSARAVAYVLTSAGWQVTIAARRLAQALELARDMRQHAPEVMISPVQLDTPSLHHRNSAWSLIVNTTPLGMFPDVFSTPWPSDCPFPGQGFVYDLVYNPVETAFLRKARDAGLPYRNGLGMLVRQAATSFERWTRTAPPLEIMMEAIKHHVLNRG